MNPTIDQHAFHHSSLHLLIDVMLVNKNEVVIYPGIERRVFIL